MATRSSAFSFRRGGRQSPIAMIGWCCLLSVLTLFFRGDASLSVAAAASAADASDATIDLKIKPDAGPRSPNEDGGVEAIATAVIGPDGTVDETTNMNEGTISSLCIDEKDDCSGWAKEGQCNANPDFMLRSCCKSCSAQKETEFGEIQVHKNDRAAETLEAIRETEDYMRNTVFVKEEYRSVREECKNRHESCAYWKVLGECEANPSYMMVYCAPACQTCKNLDVKHRCPLVTDAADVMGPGDLNALFERVTDVSDPEYAQYKPVVISRPGGGNEKDQRDGPWIVTFEDFLTPEECDRLIELGSVEGYDRSTGVGKVHVDGSHERTETSHRTSQNAWCRDECYEDPIAQRVINRIANLTGIPEQSSEHLQLLRYDENQYYKSHHDFIEYHLERQPGPRVLTLFLYLNDVQEGGGTNFDLLDITVMPKRGRALLWPSVLDEAPRKKDVRTSHQALPVEKGVKYGANAWLHQRDFKGPLDSGCI